MGTMPAMSFKYVYIDAGGKNHLPPTSIHGLFCGRVMRRMLELLQGWHFVDEGIRRS